MAKFVKLTELISAEENAPMRNCLLRIDKIWKISDLSRGDVRAQIFMSEQSKVVFVRETVEEILTMLGLKRPEKENEK